MKIVKAFNPDLTCRGYQFKEGLNVTEKANCRQNGFHGTENPLDCLSYYSDISNSVFYLCEAKGDIDEDNVDSKVSCTHLILEKKLSIFDFVAEALLYIKAHPSRPLHHLIKADKGFASKHFVIVAGKNPVAAGELGTVLGYVVRRSNGKINVYVRVIDGEDYLPNVYYDWFGDEVEQDDK